MSSTRIEQTDLARDALYTKVNQIADEKQDLLVSGTNIKTVDNQSLLGSGNISVGIRMTYDGVTQTLIFS